VWLYSFFNFAARWGGWLTPRLGRFTPGEDPVAIVQEAGLAPWPVWTVRKVSPFPELDTRTVQLVASRCIATLSPGNIVDDPNIVWLHMDVTSMLGNRTNIQAQS